MIKLKNFIYSAKYYDSIYKKKNYLKETNFVSKFFPKSKKKLKIIDLGMGTGNHLINLIKKGHKVDGVEISSNMLKLAIEKIKKNHILKNYKFYNKDIVKFKGKKNSYDVALSLFHVINYIKDFRSLEIFLSNAYDNLKKSGVLIFDCWNYKTVKKQKLKDSKKTITYKGYKIIRAGSITTKNDNKIKVSYTFKIYKNDKLLDKFQEKHNLHAFTKVEILKASKNKFRLTNNCIWFDKNKTPEEKDFSSLFIFKKINKSAI